MFFVENIHLSQIIKQHSYSEYSPQQERGSSHLVCCVRARLSSECKHRVIGAIKARASFCVYPPLNNCQHEHADQYDQHHKTRGETSFPYFRFRRTLKKQQQQNTTTARRLAHFKTTVKPVILFTSIKRQPVLKGQCFVTP